MDEVIENRVENWEVKAKEIEVDDDEEMVSDWLLFNVGDWLLVNMIIFRVMVYAN